MISNNAILFYICLLFISVSLEPLAKKIHVPFSIVLVLIGFFGSEITTKLFGIDTGIRWDNFKVIIFYGILPIIIFQSAIELNVKAFIKNIIPIIIMVLPMMLLSTFVTAAALYFGIGHADGFPWLAAFITGALLSATDPASILAILKRLNIHERLRILLEGESLFNDATAIVLFSILIAIATNSQESTSWNILLLRFLEVSAGGIVVGAIIGVLGSMIIKWLANQQTSALVSILLAYSSFIISEDVFNYSGVISVLACGVIVASLGVLKFERNNFSKQLWTFIGWLGESIIYLLAGITITISLFIDQWLAILIGIVAVIASRIVVIFGAFPFVALIPSVESINLKQQSILLLGGVRGTVTLALALSLPLTLDYWYTIQAIAYGVVIFTLFVQTMTLSLVINK